ncbi:hypothetical protein EWM60_03915 [Candidatus Erwinia dacicola]|uniref:D-serine dehydratase domain protein n=1 Tax=Candidatus Erwinia dacicola TaxID=252393 RepID=A0A328TNJ6_9GAMM|nr:hypothetical protein [Candidatus Erwinia dacicola]RAP70535.1 putative D-serine dehydratase domain protein [Candidatus Erwinia dacicola]
MKPSTLAGMAGSWRISAQPEKLAQQGISPAALTGATHLVWATGGGIVPPAEMAQYQASALKVLNP